MSIYDSSYIGTSSNRINFNDYTGNTPVYRLISRAPQRRSIRELDIPIPFENGISDFETLTGQYAYIIEGIMYPGSESDYDRGLSALRKLASLELSQDDITSDSGYVPYSWTEFVTNKQVFLKVLYVDIREDTRKGLVQPFRLVCKIKDPTIFSETLLVASTGEGFFTTASGSALYPFEYPILYGASTGSSTSDANNTGDLPTYPVSINIYGPVNRPKLTNQKTGEFIEIDVNLTAVTNQLVISYDKDSLKVERDGTSVLNKVTSASTFWKLRPGENTIKLEGASISGDAYATVSYYSAWPLS
jgi:hypothetical protein